MDGRVSRLESLTCISYVIGEDRAGKRAREATLRRAVECYGRVYRTHRCLCRRSARCVVEFSFGCVSERSCLAINFDPRGARALGFVLRSTKWICASENKRRRDTALTPDDRTGQRHRHSGLVCALCGRTIQAHIPYAHSAHRLGPWVHTCTSRVSTRVRGSQPL